MASMQAVPLPPGGPGLTKAQLKEQRRKVRNEKICLALKDVAGSEVLIPRYKLVAEHVNKSFKLDVDYVVDEAGTVVYPDQFMFECMPPPFRYFVVEKVVQSVPPDATKDARYQGGTVVVLWNVPGAVRLEDLDAWLKRGLEVTDVRFTELSALAVSLEEQLRRNAERLENVPFMAVQADTDSGQADERRIALVKLEKEHGELEARLNDVRGKVTREQQRRDQKRLRLEQVEAPHELNKRATWHCEFTSAGEATRAVSFPGWCTVRLALGNAGAALGPLAALEDELPADRVADEVIMRGVVLERARHGRGVLSEPATGVAYAGAFSRGVRHGAGKLYDDLGVYEGQFSDGQRCGRGVQVQPEGDRLEGEWGCSSHPRKPPLLERHAFCVGALQRGRVEFADGSVYEGELSDGEVTGRGRFHDPRTGERMEGTFRAGLLQGRGLHVTPHGERREGNFRDGLLHGYGAVTTRRQVVRGTFFNGLAHGKCLSEHRKGYTHWGFCEDGMRCGPGRLFYSRVRKHLDRTTGKVEREYEYEYEGLFLADRIRARNVHVTKRAPWEHEVASEIRRVESGKNDDGNAGNGTTEPEPAGVAGAPAAAGTEASGGSKAVKGRFVHERRDVLHYTTNFRSWASYPFLHKLVFCDAMRRRNEFGRHAEHEQETKHARRAQRDANYDAFLDVREKAVEAYIRIQQKLNPEIVKQDIEVELEMNDEGEWVEQQDGEQDQQLGLQEQQELEEQEEDPLVHEQDEDALLQLEKFKHLRVSLVDLIEDPPPARDTGVFNLRGTLEHYLTRERNRLIE
jgi:hypothetical protein